MTLLLRMRNEMSQMQVGKMAAVRNLREVVTTDVDLDAANQHLTAMKSGEEMHLDDQETPTGSSRAGVAGSNSICALIRADGESPLPGEACVKTASDDGTCAMSVAQCNHVGESNSVTEMSSNVVPAVSSSDSVCAVTNSNVNADQTERSSVAVASSDVNNTDPPSVPEQAAVAVVSVSLEPSNVVAQTVSVVERTTPLAAVKDVMSVQSTAPGSPHGVIAPSIRTNTVNMMMPTAVGPSATLRTLVPRIIVSTSPATTVLRVQTAAGNVATQPVPTVPSQPLILPVRNQGTMLPRV